MVICYKGYHNLDENLTDAMKGGDTSEGGTLSSLHPHSPSERARVLLLHRSVIGTTASLRPTAPPPFSPPLKVAIRLLSNHNHVDLDTLRRKLVVPLLRLLDDVAVVGTAKPTVTRHNNHSDLLDLTLLLFGFLLTVTSGCYDATLDLFESNLSIFLLLQRLRYGCYGYEGGRGR